MDITGDSPSPDIRTDHPLVMLVGISKGFPTPWVVRRIDGASGITYRVEDALGLELMWDVRLIDEKHLESIVWLINYMFREKNENE